jgi:hypothetical protein
MVARLSIYSALLRVLLVRLGHLTKGIEIFDMGIAVTQTKHKK